MSTLSSVSVDFIANTSKYTEGLASIKRNTKTTMDGIGQNVGVATQSIKTLTDAVVGLASLAVLSKLTEKFASIAKEISAIADESEKVGASASKFYALDIAARKNGASIGDVKIAYKELQKSVNEALNGNKETIDSFNQLGVSFTYISSLTPDEKFSMIAEALSKVTDENKRAELGTKLLGKAYVELSSTILGGAAGIRAATEGRKMFSDEDIKRIDQLSKAFEGVGNAINDEFRAALIKLAPALEEIAKLATLIVKNWDIAFGGLIAGFATLSISSATFVKILNFDLAASLAKVAAQGGVLGLLASIADKIRYAFAFAAFQINIVWQALGGTFSAVFTTLTAGVATLLTSFLGTLKIAAYAAKAVGMDTFAKNADETYDKTMAILARLTGFAPNPDQFGFNEAQKAAADAELAAKKLQKEANAAQLEIDKENARLAAQAKETIKQGEEYAKTMEQFGKQVTDSVKTPLELANDELDKLNEAFLMGYIGIDTYDKAVNKLKSSLDGITRAQISLNNEMTITSSQAAKFAGRGEAAQMFGLGTITGTLGEAGGTAAGLPKGVEKLTTPYDELQERLKNTGMQLLENSKTAQEVYNQEVDSIKAAVEQYKLQGREEEGLRLQTIALADASKRLGDANVDTWIKANEWIGMAANAAESFASGIANIITNGGSLKDVFNDVIKQIEMMIIKTMILQGIMAVIGLANPVAGAAFGKMVGLTPRASGGPVNSGTAYMVGENGPEMFIPKTGGYVVPNGMSAGGSPVVVNQVINVETGVSQTVRAEMTSLLPRFKQEAMAGVLDAKSRGGSYGRAFSA